MCKLGDIIVIDEYIGEDDVKVNKHSFVVINDKPDFIEGLKYDLVTNVMSSFKNEDHKNKKLRFLENVEVISKDIISSKKFNKKEGFIKADQLIYFDKSKIKYYVLGHISDELLDELIMIIMILANNNKLRNNLNNIKEKVTNWQLYFKML